MDSNGSNGLVASTFSLLVLIKAFDYKANLFDIYILFPLNSISNGWDGWYILYNCETTTRLAEGPTKHNSLVLFWNYDSLVLSQRISFPFVYFFVAYWPSDFSLVPSTNNAMTLENFHPKTSKDS